MACATLALLAACGDSTSPAARSGLYRLATVNAGPLPYFCPPSLSGSYCAIRRGEMLLRPDATFSLAIDGALFLFEGTYVHGRDSTTFTVPNGDPRQPPLVFTAPAAGDSIRLDISPPEVSLVFRASAMPAASIGTATYVLAGPDGRTDRPVTLSDTVVLGTRYVYQVAFDSLWLRDGVLFKEHRREMSTAYPPSGGPLRGESEGISYGSFTSERGWAVLQRYFIPLSSQTPVDSLAIGSGTLTRTTRLIAGSLVERYSRVQ